MCGKTRFGDQENGERKILNLYTGEEITGVYISEHQIRRETLSYPNNPWTEIFDVSKIFGLEATHFEEGGQWHEVPDGQVIAGLYDKEVGFALITTHTKTPDETLTLGHYRKPLLIDKDHFKK